MLRCWLKEYMTTQLFIDALMMVLWRRIKPTPLMHRSDQGSRNTSEDSQRLLVDRGNTPP